MLVPQEEKYNGLQTGVLSVLLWRGVWRCPYGW